DIVGYTCMEKDYLYRGYESSLSEGDFVVFDNVGAYTIVLTPPFIQTSPAIISCNASLDKFEVIRRRQELQDILATFIF
ncbi:MAG: hypothetical protein P8013_13355, partial [Candidatus Sulfobium sp.]